MQLPNQHLQSMLDILQEKMQDDSPLPSEFYDELNSHPEYGIDVIQAFAKQPYIEQLTEKRLMASLHFVELCLVQLRLALEHHHRWAEKHIDNYQSALAGLMTADPEIGHWMPMMNVFFEAGIPLDESVKQTYLQLLEQAHAADEGSVKQQLMFEQLLADDNEVTVFELADMFFAQTNALPIDFFPSFVEELLHQGSEKGKNVAILFALHPDRLIRENLLAAFPALFAGVVLPPESMSRLLTIRHWLSEENRGYIDSVLAAARKQEAVFAAPKQTTIISTEATEIDGSGAQALFFLVQLDNQLFQACGLLVKREQGIKDAWLSPPLPRREAEAFSGQGMEQGLNLRRVDNDYVELVVGAHIADAVLKNITPDISVLHVQEILNANWQGQPLNLSLTLNQLIDELPPLTDKFVKQSLKRSSQWHKTKSFSHSWFEESAELDKDVTQFCSFVEGVRHCDLPAAREALLAGYFDSQRDKWCRHFILMALWARPASRHNEQLWRDCVVIAKLIADGEAMKDIPVMTVICEESILLSIETMQYRKTHLS